MDIEKLLSVLYERLPELEWSIQSLSFAGGIPKGLFYAKTKLTAIGCIDEIKSDIEALSQQKNRRIATFLAGRIQQKINVLVSMVHIQSKKNKVEEKNHFALETISTRKQWIQTLENEVETLVQQQAAMTKTFEKMRINPIAQTLALQKELGEIEKHLTIAREALNQAIA